jgi:aspartyl-tRNA synthetase
MKEYSDLFKFGCPPHGGIGLGLDRMVQRLLKLNNVREAILLPRDPERLTP